MVDHLQQVCRQLAARHARVIDSTHYAGDDEHGDEAAGTPTPTPELERAAATLETAAGALRAAYSANGVVRWIAASR